MKVLDGVKIPASPPVQSGPSCTQLRAWHGADVIKVEYPGVEHAPGTKNQTMYK